MLKANFNIKTTTTFTVHCPVGGFRAKSMEDSRISINLKCIVFDYLNEPIFKEKRNRTHNFSTCTYFYEEVKS